LARKKISYSSVQLDRNSIRAKVERDKGFSAYCQVCWLFEHGTIIAVGVDLTAQGYQSVVGGTYISVQPNTMLERLPNGVLFTIQAIRPDKDR
jgi:hypothetical protein